MESKMSSNSRTVKGLNIAIIVLAAIALLISLGALVSFANYNAALSDPSVQSSLYNQLSQAIAKSKTKGVTSADGMAYLATVGSVGLGLSVVALISSIVALIAGILGVRNADKPNELGKVFGLTIVAIILSVFYLNIVIVILLIISAVFINKVRKSAVAIPAA